MWLRKMASLRSLEKEWLSPCLHPGSPRRLLHCHIRAQSEAKCTRWESKETSNKGGPSRRMGQRQRGHQEQNLASVVSRSGRQELELSLEISGSGHSVQPRNESKSVAGQISRWSEAK